jgi:hypothetical protein
METGTWQVQQFNRVRGIQLKAFKYKKECRRQGAAYAMGVNHGDFISEFTKKKDGAIIIKKEMLSLDNPVLLFIEGDYFVMKLQEITEYIVRFMAWNITAAVAGKIRKKHSFFTE